MTLAFLAFPQCHVQAHHLFCVVTAKGHLVAAQPNFPPSPD